eukprot:COSAG06_NODE_15205_length_1090_cov_1.116044_2_plen_28_part_01
MFRTDVDQGRCGLPVLDPALRDLLLDKG